MIGGLGKIDNQTFMIIGTQKGHNTKTRQYRNFGMANPEGYRKALRLMKHAEKFNIPIISFIDTPGAYPGLEAEERGQGEAIARNLYEMMSLKVPIIVIIIGEGASGGALGIGIGDCILMLENTWYSVISPESCSSILWRSWDYKEQAAETLKLTADDMYDNKLIDKIIKEPFGGAHYNPEEISVIVKEEILNSFKKLQRLSTYKLISNRRKRFYKIGKFNKAINRHKKYLNEDNIFIFGIKPTKPETGYGYIKMGSSMVHFEFYKVPPFLADILIRTRHFKFT